MVFVLLLILFLISPLPAQAQFPTLRFFHLTTADGLSHDIVYAIVQDQQGFLWFGTQDGLARYDGYFFVVFRHLRSDPSSLIDNTVQALAVDSAGALWVGTAGGLDRYDRNGRRFVHYGDVAESVTAIYEGRDGALWVGTASAGLFRYDRPADRFVPFGAGGPSRPYVDDHILALYQDQEGTLWVGTEYSGLWRSNEAAGFVPVQSSQAAYRRVTAITQDRNGMLWVGSGALHEPEAGGLFSLDPHSGQLVLYRQGLAHAHVTAVLEDRAGVLWVGTENGLAALDRASGRFSVYHHDPLDPYSLVNDRVYALYEDNAGILWIATDGGVSRYVREKDRFTLYRHNPLDPNGLSASRVGAVLLDRSGTLWVGFHAGGLDRIDSTGAVVHYQYDPADASSLSHDHVTALLQDRSGAIWVGTSAGLDRLEPALGRFTHYVHDPGDPSSIGPGAVKVIYEDRAGALWIGTEEPGTLSRLDPATGRFTVYRYDPARPDGFPNTYGIRAILEDQAGDLWLGTYNGLVRFDPRSGAFIQYRYDPQDPNSLSDDFVWALYEAADGTLWVGTHGGLNRLERATGQFVVYTIEEGLPNDSIAAILGDEGRGEAAPRSYYLWLATMGGGLSRFDPRTETFRNYDTSDGLQGMHFIIGAAFRSADGELFFGGAEGLNRFYAVDIQDNPHVPPIVLTAFRKFDQVVDFGRDLADVSQITLSYQDNFFSFEFAALDYAYPAGNRYAYILEGFDRDWVYCGTRRYAAYTNVPPGSYTFRVRGSNNDGVWNDAGLAVRVVITPPFWATWWFRSLAALVVLGIALAVARARMRYIAALREREERFRTLFENAPLGVCEADLTCQPPLLLHANPAFERLFGQPLEALQKQPLAALFLPDALPVLERICRAMQNGEKVTLEATGQRGDGSLFPLRLSAAAGPGSRLNRCILAVEDLTAEKVRRSEEEAIAEERRRIAREIHDGLAQDLAGLRLQVRRWQALVESDPARAKAELDELHRLLGDKIREVRRAIFALRPVALDELGFWSALRRFLAEFGEQNQLHVSLQVEGAEDSLPVYLEPTLFRIVQEALNNVAKHAGAHMVWVTLDLREGVELRVCDDGSGFDPADLPEMARRGHLGLTQMRERVEALGGRLEVRSQPGQGAEICIALRK